MAETLMRDQSEPGVVIAGGTTGCCKYDRAHEEAWRAL